MKIEKGVTYWGRSGNKETRRKVDLIETRSSGTRYVIYTNKKLNGLDGATKWTTFTRFYDWAKGIYEKDESGEGIHHDPIRDIPYLGEDGKGTREYETVLDLL